MSSDQLTQIKEFVIGIPFTICTFKLALNTIHHWAKEKSNKYVCISNVHSIITAQKDADLRHAIFHSDLTTPDGAPVAWALRQLGHHRQRRINGPDLMHLYLSKIRNTEESVFLYGNTTETLDILKNNLEIKYRGLKIAGSISPPFRPLTEDEAQEHIKIINNSMASTVWVSLGCPKQEIWMSKYSPRINAVLIGVGAAFDYHANTIKRSPKFLQKYGLEWLFRLFMEPKRLWRRYLYTNSMFIFKIIPIIISAKLYPNNQTKPLHPTE